MRILVISQYYFPENFRINDICEELLHRGHRVTVLTGLPNYPEGEIFPGYEDGKRNDEWINGVHVLRCNIRPRHKGALNLLRNYLSFAHSAGKKVRTLGDEFDVIFVYELSPVTVGLPAIRYKRRFHKPIYFYCGDLWPEAVRGEHNGHAQISRQHPIYLTAKEISKYIYKRVDVIGAKCQEFIDYLASECKVPPTKMHVLFEHAEESYLSVREQPEPNGVIDFMFLGNMGKAQNCDQIISAAAELKPTKPFRVHLVGEGSELSMLKQQVRDLQLDDVVIFHGKHPVSEVNRFYDYADVCLLTLSNRTATGLTPPGKLTSYMAAARPILASINGAARSIIKEAGCGDSVAADDVAGLRGLMQNALDGQYDFSRMGKNGREYFKEYFSLTKYVEGLEAHLRELCQGQAGKGGKQNP